MKFCLIGSSRFGDLYQRANRELTLKGHLVYSIATVSSAAGTELPEESKMILDLVHLRKIQESDLAILITDETGYYGFSTRREMIWSNMIQRPLFVYVTKDPEEAVIAHISPLTGPKGIADLPEPNQIAEVIFEARHRTDSGWPTQGGTA